MFWGIRFGGRLLQYHTRALGSMDLIFVGNFILYVMNGHAYGFLSFVSIMHYLFLRGIIHLYGNVVFISGGGSTVETQDFASFSAPQEFCNGV